MLHQLVARIFDQTINERFKAKPNVRDFLIRHERKEVVLNNICQQIRMCELSSIRTKFDAEKLLWVVTEMAVFFAKTALDHKQEQMLSKAEVNRRVSDADKFKQLQEQFDKDQEEALSAKIISYPT